MPTGGYISHQRALTTLIGEVLADANLAHDDVFRRMLQAGLQDLINAEATDRIVGILDKLAPNPAETYPRREGDALVREELQG